MPSKEGLPAEYADHAKGTSGFFRVFRGQTSGTWVWRQASAYVWAEGLPKVFGKGRAGLSKPAAAGNTGSRAGLRLDALATACLSRVVRQIAIERAKFFRYRRTMQNQVDLKQMTLSEKLRLMEAIWDDLCGHEEEIPIPDWHKTVLDERERQIAEGKAMFVDWETAKERIRKRIS